MKREADSLTECADELNCSNLTIVTMNQKDTIHKNGYDINVVPIGRF